ncbi:MAG: DNA polymerase/3'-5' exonuclease PolX [Verrucomicrobia bacterium]|nr:MAG: DNA polymerase/3'-5' exonuclease PolX [Verrucomicrobiota bacterium]
MTKNEIAAVLEEIGALLELKGENPFKIRAYVNAARSIEAWGGSLSDLQDEEALGKIPGIGKSIADKIKELAATGSLKYLEELRAEFPAAILQLFSISGLGAKKIKALNEKLQISSIEQLLKACETGRVAKLPGFGETTQAKICKAIEERARHSGYFQFGQIAGEAETLRSDLAAQPGALQVDVAGSYRRRKEIVHDVDLVVATKTPEANTKFFVAHPLVDSIIAQGPTKSSVRLRSGIQCDLRVVSATEYPFALAYFTGNKEHNIELRSRALQRGWTLNEYRLAPLPPDPKAKKKRPVKKIPTVGDEADLYRAVDLDFIAPELRENTGEFGAAEKHSLPKLIEKENLRGTFHCHTTASDGHNSLEEMAEAAQVLGLEYLGIAEHSRSSVQAHGLDKVKLHAQVAAIAKVNKKFDGFRLFAGVECDILRDGSLDFDDEVLSELDFVVASIHSVFNLSEAEMTRRIIRAISNPLVTILAHPTGRLLLKREPYQIDIPAILDAAAETGTWVELNAAPKRLDLDWRWWPLAKEKGVNCLPLGKIERALRAKRTR